MRILLSVCLLVLASTGAAAAEITVFAAASLTDVLTEIGKTFNAQGSDSVRFSFAASSTLAKQIESGAPASVFVSADEQWMDYVQTRGLIVAASRRDLLANELVLIEAAGGPAVPPIRAGFDLKALLGQGRLAMGDPESVPAGKYGKEALTRLGAWDAVKDHVAAADSVRSALAFVQRGEAPFGIVYSTDAALAKAVQVAGTFPEDSHKPIIYPIALVAAGASPAAQSFVAFLQGAEARSVFVRYGFRVP